MDNNGSRVWFVALPLLLIPWAALAQDPASDDTAIEQIVVTGIRVANRSALETAVPVDVVSGEQPQQLGVAEVSQALSVTIPSFNFPRPGLNDGTDTVRPATLRGLAPDQVLTSAARPVAANVNQMRSPTRNPAMKAGAPRVPPSQRTGDHGRHSRSR